MKRASILLSGLLASSVAVAEPISYIGTMGQSNSDGAHSVSVLTSTPPYPTQALMLGDAWGVRGPGALSSSASGIAAASALVPAFETNGPSQIIPPSLQYGETNVTAMMAEQIHEGSRAVYVGRSNGAPSHILSRLLRGSAPYRNALADLATAEKLADGALIEPAVAMIEGSGDRFVKTDPGVYCAESQTLATTWTADVQAVTGQTTPIVFYQMQLAADHIPANSMISQCQLTLGLTDPRFRLVAPSYMMVTSLGWGPHFDGQSQRLQGEYLGHAMRHADWKPTYPTLIRFSSPKTIVVTVHTPVGPLVRDFVGVPQGAAPHDGFTFHDDCGDATVADDRISGPNQITITLTAAAACANPMLDYAFDRQAAVGPTTYSGTWGNIRDSDPTIGFAGDHLYNWLVMFSEPVM